MNKSNLSISSLLSRLINSPSPKLEIPADAGDKKLNTTLRLEPAVKAFIEAEADKLGISVQEFLAMTLRAIMVATHAPAQSELELMLERFTELFSVHGVAAADIPKLAPGLARSDLLDTTKMVDRLDDPVLNAVADLFMVDVDWLKGVRDQPYGYSLRRWYKNPEGFAARLAYLKMHSRDVRVYFCVDDTTGYEELQEAKSKGDGIEARQMCVVVECEQAVKGANFRTYDVWEAERWNYSRCRLYLKVLMLMCQKARVYYDGIQVAQSDFAGLCNGSLLAASAFRRRNAWHPDQLFWNDDRNLERDEIKAVKALYKEHEPNMADALKALESPLSVVNWESCLQEGFRFKGAKDDETLGGNL